MIPVQQLAGKVEGLNTFLLLLFKHFLNAFSLRVYCLCSPEEELYYSCFQVVTAFVDDM